MQKQFITLVLLSIALTTFFAGCKQKTTNKEVVDSTAANKNPDPFQMIPDQHTKQRIEMAGTVYKKIKFGITEKQYRKIQPNKEIKIGDWPYVIVPEFNSNGKLAGITIRGSAETRDEYNPFVSEQMKTLIGQIIEKYGQPLQPIQEIDFSYFKPGDVQYVCSWLIRSKEIKVGIENTSDGLRYAAHCSIFDNDIRYVISDNEKESKVEEKSEPSNF